LQLARVEPRFGARRIVGGDDVDALGRPPRASELQALVEQRMQRGRHAMQLRWTAERGDLGDDARQVVDRDRDLAGEIPSGGVVEPALAIGTRRPSSSWNTTQRSASVASTVACATESRTRAITPEEASACPTVKSRSRSRAQRRVARVRAIFERSSSRTNGLVR